MAFDLKRSRLTFQNLDRELGKLAKKPAPERVHKFRTNSRRVEALLSEAAPKLRSNDEKLLKLLSRLRKKAGWVRDLDVQITALRGLKFPQANGHKSQLMDALIDERRQRERKLAKAFDRDTTAEVRKRLKRARRDLKIPPNADPLAVTLGKLRDLARNHAPLTEKTLHQYRVFGKRARYVAELAGNDSEAKRVVEQLKHMQDVIGDWHDWLKLTQRAEELVGSVRDSALVAMLRNITQAKFRLSLDAVAEIRSAFAASQPVRGEKLPKKAAARAEAA
ncbi:MAG TPA: CHAD domain-containing protein [Terriglobales bacterium]|nr:CHAD domain-containing protein [Terriglobales bacterium]